VRLRIDGMRLNRAIATLGRNIPLHKLKLQTLSGDPAQVYGQITSSIAEVYGQVSFWARSVVALPRRTPKCVPALRRLRKVYTNSAISPTLGCRVGTYVGTYAPTYLPYLAKAQCMLNGSIYILLTPPFILMCPPCRIVE
jgi:hypothetical protein